MNISFPAFDARHPVGESATHLLARLVRRPALSRLLAGMSLLRRCFAPAIPPKRASRSVQLRNLG
ncbi:MAG: hypothetical protein U0989_08635 [Azonexus sp.]|nr:hypothetical protein [Azonexus sp.]